MEIRQEEFSLQGGDTMTEYYERMDKEDERAIEMKKLAVLLFEELVRFIDSNDDAHRKNRMLYVTHGIEKLENLANEIVRLQGGEWL